MSREDLLRWAHEISTFGSDLPMFIAGFDKALSVLELDANIRLSQLDVKAHEYNSQRDERMLAYIAGSRNELCVFIEKWIKGFKEPKNES